MDQGFQLKRPCKNCPFTPEDTRIRFMDKERATEIAESAYRNGFPCHLSAVDSDPDGESEDGGGYVFGEKTQHCAGAIMMFLRDGNECGWPGIFNDEELAERLEQHMDWTAPHYESEDDFIKNAVEDRYQCRKPTSKNSRATTGQKSRSNTSRPAEVRRTSPGGTKTARQPKRQKSKSSKHGERAATKTT